MSRQTRRQFLTTASTLGCGLWLAACTSVSVHNKPENGLTRSSSFAIAAEDDVTETRSRLTARLISRGYNVIASLPVNQGATEQADAVLPGRLRRVSNAIPDDAPEDNGFASRYVFEVSHQWRRKRRFGIKRLEYTRLTARMVDRVTGQILLTAITDGGKIDETLDEIVDSLDRQLGD